MNLKAYTNDDLQKKSGKFRATLLLPGTQVIIAT